MSFLSLALSLLFVPTLIAQQPQAPPQQSEMPPQQAAQPVPPEQKCSIEGQVVRMTGEPLKKARVTLRRAEGRDPGYAALTDASGKFLLKNVDPGRFRLLVSRQGYVQQEYGQRGAARQGSILTLAPGTRMRDLVFKMVPAAVITGRVLDEDGEPMERANIAVLRYNFFQGRRQLTPSGGGSTNDRGEYRIFGLAPGRYYLSASYTPGMAFFSGEMITSTGPESQQEEGYAPTYYPGTTDASRASAVEVRAGDEVRGIDFTFTPARAYRIRGRVFNSITGQPARNVQVFLYPREGMRSFFMQNRAMVNPQSAFELRNVLPGSYFLTGSWFDEGKSYVTRMSVDVGEADIEGVLLTIAPGMELSGNVRVEGGDLPLADLRVFLQSKDENPFGGAASGTIKPDGTFTLQNVSEGSYTVLVAGQGETSYLKSVRAGTEEVVDVGLNVMKGKALSSLEVVISVAGGRVEGLVTNADELPVSGALVVLVPEPARRSQSTLYKTTTTDQFGRFSIKGVRPGEYKVFAWEEIESGMYQDPDFLRPLESKGKTVRIEESSGQAVELKVIPAPPPGS